MRQYIKRRRGDLKIDLEELKGVTAVLTSPPEDDVRAVLKFFGQVDKKEFLGGQSYS